MLFTDRFDAALKLMPCLKNFRQHDAVVFAVPGGGVPVGYYISKDYNFPMELLLAKKIRHPEQNMMSIGAVTLSDHIIEKGSKVPENYIRKEITNIRNSLKQRHKQFMEGHKENNVRNKVVFIVDDGATTGNTLLSAIRVVKQRKPRKILVAIPVAPEQTIARLQKEADDVICLHSLKNMVGVESNYLNYPRVSDTQIYQLFNSTVNIQKVA